MVQYEIALILRALPKGEIPRALQGAVSVVLQQGGVLQKTENLGQRTLPFRMGAHGEKFTEGRYVLLKVEAPPKAVQTIKNKLRANTNVVRASLIKLDH